MIQIGSNCAYHFSSEHRVCGRKRRNNGGLIVHRVPREGDAVCVVNHCSPFRRILARSPASAWKYLEGDSQAYLS